MVVARWLTRTQEFVVATATHARTATTPWFVLPASAIAPIRDNVLASPRWS